MIMMVEQTVNESGRDARGSCLSSAYVWTSSKVFLPTLSSAGKSNLQKERLTTSVEVFDVALVPLCCCVTSLFASPTLTVDNRSQRMNLWNVLIFRLPKVMCGNFFYIQIQRVCVAAWPLSVWNNFSKWKSFRACSHKCTFRYMLQCCGVNREVFIGLVVCQVN